MLVTHTTRMDTVQLEQTSKRVPVNFAPLLALETRLLARAYTYTSKADEKEIQKRRPNIKQTYVLIGEPRIGKTTLALFATLSRFSMHVDPDGFSADTLESETQAALTTFFTSSDLHICIITIGLHRRQNNEVLQTIKKERLKYPKNFLTICRLEKVL